MSLTPRFPIAETGPETVRLPDGARVHRPNVHYSEATTASLLGTTITALDHYRASGKLRAVDRGGVLMYDANDVVAEIQARRDRLNAEVLDDYSPAVGISRALIVMGALTVLAAGAGVWWWLR